MSTRAGPSIVAAFEPFGGRTRNRSWEAVRRLELTPGVERVLLPVDFVRLRKVIPKLAARIPSALLLVGEVPSGPLRVEGVALNVLHSDRPDNAGSVVADVPIVPGAPLALRVRWNPGEVTRALTAEGIPAVPSFHAGTYACNAALYLALHHLPASSRVGFLHLPRRGGPPGTGLPRLVRAVELVFAVLTS
ncbi:MAG: pyroglutamyl-peptidase I [Gemmatimonadota bacterium]